MGKRGASAAIQSAETAITSEDNRKHCAIVTRRRVQHVDQEPRSHRVFERIIEVGARVVGKVRKYSEAISEYANRSNAK